MKRFLSVLLFSAFLYIVSFNAFSFVIDGHGNGVEWDGASVYKLVDGESNCGVNFGLVKAKFDYEGNAVYLCFNFIDPEFASDNVSAGVSITVDNSATFEISASEGTRYDNVAPYSFEGAIFVDENHGANCEIRVGIKSGLPEQIDFDARFIDAHGHYSDFYHFEVKNELYEVTEPVIVNPTADTDDPAYNSDIITVPTERTTKPKTTKSTTAKKTTTKKSTTTKRKSEILTTTSYSYTRRPRTTVTKKTETESKNLKTTEALKTNKIIEKIHYYEKEVYISEVYITVTQDPSTTVASTTVTETVITDETTVSLSKGTKYKKIISAAALVGLISLAFIGVYSAKKSKNNSSNQL